jgi:hypothetical protein
MNLIFAIILAFQVWLPMIVSGETCDISQRNVIETVEEPGINVRFARWSGCPRSSVFLSQTYVDKFGVQYTTGSVLINENQWYYTPRWMIWRNNEWVKSSKDEFLRENNVRMNIAVNLVGQNYTHEVVVE